MYHNTKPEKSFALLTAAVLLGAMLVLAPTGVRAQQFVTKGSHANIVNDLNNTAFTINATAIFGANITTSYNIVGTGGNDNFTFIGGNSSTDFLATGTSVNRFNITTGNGTGTWTPTGIVGGVFSLSSGDNSSFFITQKDISNFSGTFTFVLSGGKNCNLTEVSPSAIGGNVIYSVDFGTNSTVNLESSFNGTITSFNLIF